jgi:hypothetical protein
LSATALDNPLVREYLHKMDAAFARLPARQGNELREQITAHITDAVPPGAPDEQVAAVRRTASANHRLGDWPVRRNIVSDSVYV